MISPRLRARHRRRSVSRRASSADSTAWLIDSPGRLASSRASWSTFALLMVSTTGTTLRAQVAHCLSVDEAAVEHGTADDETLHLIRAFDDYELVGVAVVAFKLARSTTNDIPCHPNDL